MSLTLFIVALFNSLTVAALYFLAAAGFTLIFGLMRIVNLAHGAIYLLGGYVGFVAADATNSWVLGILAGGLAGTIATMTMNFTVLRGAGGDDMRQALITFGVAMIISDLLLWRFGGLAYQFELPELLTGAIVIPGVGWFSLLRLAVLGIASAVGLSLWFVVSRTKLGALVRAGVDDETMLSAIGTNIKQLHIAVFALSGFLVGMAGVVGGSVFSMAPGEDVRFLLSSLMVVIIGGMGSVSGAAVGALIVALSEQFGLIFYPDYAAAATFAILVAILAVRPQGLFGKGLS
jgi:branched-chain amino acid transport system permease protein